MALLWLDHVNIRTSNLAMLEDFYQRVLGMQAGPRPSFSFNGRWMYVGDRAWVHLVERAEQPRVDETRMDHFAIRAQGLDEFVETAMDDWRVSLRGTRFGSSAPRRKW